MKPQSAYRQNMMNQLNKQAQAAPVNTGNLGRDLLGSIGNMARTNPAQANKLFSQYQTFTQDPTSPIYKPYQKATNPAFKALADLGFDASGLDREWFNNNTEWQNYLVYGDKTNTPKDPGKKGTIQQKIAYQLNQYAKGLDSTEAMDSEWAAMKDDINYWANRTDLNLSPDQIVDKVTKNMKTKYPTLYKMDNSTNPGETLLELNHGTDYSRDGMYGAIWAARNNGGTGSNLMDIVMGSMGEGNVWQKNDAIAAALDRNNPDTYAPYSIGMTLEDEGAYFGVPYFTDEKLEEIQRDLDYNNPAEVEMYNNVFSAHKTTKDGLSQRENLIKDVDRWINLGYSEEKILKNLDNALDSPDYNILRQMDDSIANGTKLVKTTQRIDYKKSDLVQRIKDVVAIRDGKKDASDMMQEMGLEGYSDGQQQVNDVMSQHAAMIADSIWGGLSPVEQKYFQTSPKLNGKQVAEMVYKAKQGLLGPANQDIDMNWVADMATKQAASAEKDYIGVNLDTLTVRSQYEKVRQEADGIQQQLNDLDQKYSNIILAGKEIPEKMTIVVDEDTGLSVTYTMDPDGKYRYHPSDNVAFEYNLPAQDYMRNNGLTPDELLEQLRHGDTLTRANNYADSIRSAKETAPSGDISPEEIAQADETIKSLQSKLDGYRSYMAEHQEEYDNATAKLNAADARRKRIGDITLRKSGFSVDPAQSDAVVNYVSFFSDWQKPTDTIYSVIDDLNYTYNSLNGTPYDEDAQKAVEANIADIDDQIESAQYVLQNYENIPQQYAKSIQANIDYLESRKRLYGDFLLSKEENFQDLVDEGKRMNMTGSSLEYGVNALQFNQLDKDEQDVYFALIASQGIDAAKQFLDDINGNLLTRMDETIDAATKELAKSGAAGRILNEAFSIGSAAIEVPLNMAYMVESIFGKGDEWLRVPSKAAKAANQATIDELHNVYKDTVWDKVWPTLAEMVNNRGRSMVSNYAFGWLIPEGAGDIFHAFPIASIAMTDAYAEAKEHNMEDWQAWTLAGINFLAESVTEGIEFGHYNEIFQNGVSLQSFSDYFMGKIAGLDWLSEATGETLNNIIERSFDKWIGGDKSEHRRRVQSYIDSGICDNEQDAELMVAADYLKEDIHTALVSALSSFLDVGTFSLVKLKSNVDYAMEVQQYRKMGDAETTIKDLKNRDRAILEGMQRADAKKRAGVAEEQQQTTAEETEQAPRVLPSVAPESVQNAQQDEYDTDLTILENARGADITALTSTLSAVLQINEQNSDQAAASAQALSDLFGEEYLDSVENVMYGGVVAGVDIGAIKMGLQYAALADGACKETVQSEEFQKASPDQQAQMLAEANVQDAQSAEVQTTVAGNVKEARIAAIEQQIMADSTRGTMVEQAQKALADKWLAELDAQKNLETQRGIVAAAAQSIVRANEAIRFGSEPTATAVDNLVHASKEHQHQLAVEQEYQQRLENAQREHKDAEANLEQAQQDTRAEIRAEAEQIVAKEDADRAAQQAEIEAEQQAAEQAAIEEQQRLQAEEDERTGVAQEARENNMIETVLDNENLEGEERDQRRDALSNQRDAVKESNVDLNGKVTNAEGFLAINAFSRKLGLTFDMADLPENVRGKYENGIVYLNQNRVKSGSMSVGQAMVEAALHEVTHFMENTGAYKTYRNTVLDSLFSGTGINSASSAMELYNNSPSFRAAIDNIINERTQAGDRLGGDDQETKIQNAEKELIADFARTKLAQKDTVQRFMDAGLGGRIRNALHNINQAMKNYFSGMTGEERQQAEYLRKAERAYQKAMTQAARSAVHPESSQFSIMQVAQAAGLNFDAETMTLFDKDNNAIDGVNNKVTTEIMSQTPVGYLIRTGLDLFDGENKDRASSENGYIDPTSSAGKAMEMMTGLMNMIARYKDSDLVWEIGASTLSSTFSAMKANADPQYRSTVDFGTICAKTQAIVDVMSQVMLDKIDPETGMLKEGMKPGLTRKDVMKVYDATHNANLSVPCPVCYVFSRWMGVPSLLGQMSQFQKDHVIMKEDGKSIDWDATQTHVDEYVAKMYEKYGDKDGVNNKKTSLQNRLTSLEYKRNDLETKLFDKSLTKEEKTEIRNQIEDLLGEMTDVEEELGEVRAFNWVARALCVDDGSFKVDKKHFKKITPDSVLFDLNKTSEFAEYEKNWKYRTTRGAGMGKAIMPYSGETIGDILKGVNKGKRQSNLKNPWLNYVEGGSNAQAKRQLNDARTRARQQNLLGGQRLQSTSDFRPEWGLDYIMSFLELQAAGSKVQMYTKVAEAIDFFASVGADVNMSIMGKGSGWHEATAEELKQMTPEQREQATINGKVYVLDFSNITGMDYDTARRYKDKYNNVQMILVGMNDTHIRLAIKNSDIDFVIPWHSSGNSKEVLSGLISSVGEKLNASVDYTTTQSDMVKGETKSYYDENGEKVKYTAPGKQTEAEKHLWDLRMRILTGKANKTADKGGFTAEERKEVYNDPWLNQLYERFYVEGKDANCYHVVLTGDQAKQIFPYEYWDTSLTKDQADQNGKRFVEYCDRMGIIPRFSQFKDDPGYWKLLIDRPMYNNDGTYHEQQTINVTNARIGSLDESGKLDKSTTDLPTQAQAVYAPKDKRSPKYQEYTQRQTNAVNSAEEALGMKVTEKQSDAIEDAKALNEVPYRDGVDAQLSVYGDLTEADIDLMDDSIDLDSEIDTQNQQRILQYSVDGEMTDADRDLMLHWTEKDKKAWHDLGEDTDGMTPIHAGTDATLYKFLGTKRRIIERVNKGKITEEDALAKLKERYDYYNLDDRDAKVLKDYVPSAWSVKEQNATASSEPVQSPADVATMPKRTRANVAAELNRTLVNAGVLSQDEVDKYNYRTSRPLEGQNPWMSTAQGPKQRQFGTGMLQDSDEIDRAAKAYALEQNSYFPDTNEEQIDRAINWIRSNKRTPNSDGFYESYQKVIDPKFDYRSADGQARMVAVMGMAVAKNDIMSQVSLTDAFNRQGTDLGRALQARKLFRLMTPEGRISTLRKMLSDTQNDINSNGTNIDLKFSEWIYRAAAAATEEGDFERVYQAAAAELAQQVPANWKDKLRGWRMLSMLGNPRTHIRNVIGNALFVPAVGIKNKLGAVGEIVTRQKERTKTLSPVLASDIREFARQDAQSIKDILTGESKYNEGNPVKREQKPFKGLLQAVIDFNGNMLEAEDWLFLKGHYRRALGGWMQANKYTADQLRNDPALLEKGRAYAIQEAQKATYRDFNKLASTLNGVSRQGGVAGFLVDATLPFKKTPANILRRGIEYSPAGIMRSLTSDLYHLKQWNDFQKGKLNALPDKAISPTEFIDHLCSGLTGTAIMAVGALLSSAGVVACGLDDDDDKFEKENGNQKYSFKFNIAGQDFTYTIDWAAPMSMPFFVGSAIYDQLSKEGEVDVNTLVNGFGNITEPVFNLTMLDGINTLFKTSQYDDTNTLTQIGGKIVSNYATSFVPSLLGAVARTVDDTQRKNFVKSGEGTGLTGTFNYAREQVENKIPGVSQSNIPVRDIWGNEKTSSLAERIVENFISPGYIENYKDDPIINEMARLFEITGESKLIPSDPPKSFSYKNHTYKLEAEQWDAYKETRGKTAFTMLKELLGSSDYREADSATQANMIKEVWDYADKVGKKAALPEYDFDQMTVETISTDAKISGYKDEMMKALASEDYDAFDTMIEALHEQGVEDKDIKSKISGKYRDLYKEAYRKNDERTMGEIKDLLVYGTSLYSKKDIAGWEKDVDEKYGLSSAVVNSKPNRPVSDTQWDQYMGDLEEYWSNYDFSQNDPVGRYGKGTIDMNNRKIVQNDDGSISTDLSFSFYDDNSGKEVLIPQVVDGKVVSEQDAIDHYYETVRNGKPEYFGMFDDWKDADEYSVMLHNRGAWYYLK